MHGKKEDLLYVLLKMLKLELVYQSMVLEEFILFGKMIEMEEMKLMYIYSMLALMML